MLLPDGGCYTGTFKADAFEGEGTYEYPDGSCYLGPWLAGKKHGSGARRSQSIMVTQSSGAAAHPTARGLRSPCGLGRVA
jgi:hypothetical protein